MATVITTTLTGAEWMTGRSFIFGDELRLGWDDFVNGFYYTIPFLGFLTTHEFGHYFMAKYRKVKVTLPYYIPFWFGIISTFGTMGAFIRIKQEVKSRNDYFDIGIAGPLAGFVVALAATAYGFANLPDIDYIFTIHPEYKAFGANYGDFVYKDMSDLGAMRIGDSFLSGYLKDAFANPTLIPHPNEMIHYPIVVAGFLGLFFTALNLLPVGQLDGGHILFALIGEKNFNIVSPVIFSLFTCFAGIGFFTPNELTNTLAEDYLGTLMNFAFYIYFIYICVSKITENTLTNWCIALSIVFIQLLSSRLFPEFEGYSGFLAFAFLIGRLLGVYHPPVDSSEELGTTRIVLGWLAIVIFVLCFSPYPFY